MVNHNDVSPTWTKSEVSKQNRMTAGEMTAGESKGWDVYRMVMLTAALIATVILYREVFAWLVEKWLTDSDYSHGFLVILFSLYLLASNQLAVNTRDQRPSQGGLAVAIGCFGVSLLVRIVGVFTHALILEAASLIPFLIGTAAIVFGGRGVKWSVSPALFLAFMIPLPEFLAGRLSGLLQSIATEVSTYALQTIGVPALAEGNIITLTSGQIGVAEACSGLQMLYAFIALTTGACLIIDRSGIEKCFIAASAVPIAIMANCIRIIVTGFIFEHSDSATTHSIFHDASGWLMVPLGFVILMIGLAILDHAIEPEDTDPLVRGNLKPADLNA